METISILIASWHNKDRAQILTVLSGQNDFLIAGVEKDESGAIIKSESLKPDVLILDLQLSGLSGHELAPIIHRRSPQTSIVMMCEKDEEDYAGLALKSGISGFLLKETDTDKLVPVIKIVFYGGCYISASIVIRVFSAAALANNFPEQTIEQKNGVPIFTATERGIIKLIAQGFSDEEIAEHLHFSAGTIKNCVNAIKQKTKLKNRVQIVIYSLVYGLISFEQIGFEVKVSWINNTNTGRETDNKPE